MPLNRDQVAPPRPPGARPPAPSGASQPVPRPLGRSADESFEITLSTTTDLLCLSHLRWDVAVPRPQQLMTRFAKERRVFFVEEPACGACEADHLRFARRAGVVVVTPQLAIGLSARQVEQRLRLLLNEVLRSRHIRDFVLWYYTPMAMGFTRHLQPRLVVWDCIVERSAFAQAPAELLDRERQLLAWSDLVFTAGRVLYEAKRDHHPAVHDFPTTSACGHVATARRPRVDPTDQAMARSTDHRRERVDRVLGGDSWDTTTACMRTLIDAALQVKDTTRRRRIATTGVGRGLTSLARQRPDPTP